MINKIIASISKYFLFNKTMKIYRSLASRDINQSIANAEFQNNKLFKILEIAFNDIPYYQNKGIPISKESFTYDNFLKIPILTKEIIRNRTKELINHKNKNDDLKYLLEVQQVSLLLYTLHKNKSITEWLIII